MPEDAPKRRLSFRTRLLFSLFLLLILWVVFDTLAYGAFWYLSKTRNMFIDVRPALTDAQIARWYEYGPFHARWGWDITEQDRGQFGNRKGRQYPAKEQYTMKVFGDSFAYAAGMKDSETFEYLIEEKTGWECLNYGVTGFGTDQALLKYMDTEVKTKYTVLCVLDENIERCLDTCRGLLDSRQGKKPKPRFWMRPDGSVILLENPIQNAADLRKLKDRLFLESLRQHHYWSDYYKRLNAPSKVQWPGTLTIIRHFDYFWGLFCRQAKHKVSPTFETHLTRAPYYHMYEEGAEGLKIMQYVINTFVATAKARNEIPVVLLFPKRETLEGIRRYHKKPYQSLVTFLKMAGYDFIDFGDTFVTGDMAAYFIEDGHYSRIGNEVVANTLIDFVQRRSQTAEVR
jgi:hypothetical protein